MSETSTNVRSALTWFEIPTADFDRARRFYETILETTLNERPFGSSRIAVFPYQQPGVGGCITESSPARPSDDGVVIYINVDGRFDRTLQLIESASGRVVVPKTVLPEGMGSMAHMIDSEGNRVGLHAMS